MTEFDKRVLRLFSRGESFDAEGFASLFADAPVYQFGNTSPALDRGTIVAATQSFFDGLDALYHDIKAIRTGGDAVFVEMDVHYWRKGSGSVVLPCLDVLRFDRDDAVVELRIGMDAAAVTDSSVAVPEDASVFVGPGGTILARAHPMRRYYSDDEDGRTRVVQGRPPRWSSAGPHWALPRPETLPLDSDPH